MYVYRAGKECNNRNQHQPLEISKMIISIGKSYLTKDKM